MSMSKIVIVGAGTNGLVLAIALCQLGFSSDDIAIYEKNDFARAEGTGIIFWSEVVSLLKTIGIDLTQTGVCLPKLKSIFLNESASPFIVEIDKSPGQEAFGFLREKVYNQLLIKAQSYGIKINTGYECQNVIENETNCTLFFKNINLPVIADVVIGCDGIYSKVRNIIFPDLEPTPLHIRAYRGTFTGSKDDIHMLGLPQDACHVYCGENYRVILYPNFVDNQKQLTSYYWFTAHRIQATELSPRISRNVLTDEIETLIKNMPHCPDNLQSLMRETSLQNIIPNSTLRQLPFSPCYKGRIALLGDSIHGMAPTAGLGFLLGLINALHLAGNLKQHNPNLPIALKEYAFAVNTHSQACLDYTEKLTNLFYVKTPLNTAKDAQNIYAEMYQLIAKASSYAAECHKQVVKQHEDAAATCLQSAFRGYLIRKSISTTNTIEQSDANQQIFENKLKILSHK